MSMETYKIPFWEAKKLLRILQKLMDRAAGKGQSRPLRLLARWVHSALLAGMTFGTNLIPVRASALTYTTILAFIPFVAILSAVAGHFGYLDVLTRFFPYLNDTLDFDLPLDKILEVIENAQQVNFEKLGLIGSGGLLLTFFLSMGNIELAVNNIWNIRKKKNLWKRIKTYTPFMLFLILLVVIAANGLIKYKVLLNSEIEGTGFVQHTLFLVNILAVGILVWLGLAFLFILIPNTQVRFIPAMMGSTTSLAAIYLFSRVFVLFAKIMLNSNHLIYGSLAIVPVLLLFLYISWILVLFGAAVSFVYQRLYHIPQKLEGWDSKPPNMHLWDDLSWTARQLYVRSPREPLASSALRTPSEAKP